MPVFVCVYMMEGAHFILRQSQAKLRDIVSLDKGQGWKERGRTTKEGGRNRFAQCHCLSQRQMRGLE